MTDPKSLREDDRVRITLEGEEDLVRAPSPLHLADAQMNEALKTYAFEATKAITGLVGGGSEMFAGRIGEMFKADLSYCVERLRDRQHTAQRVARDAVLREKAAAQRADAAEDLKKELRDALLVAKRELWDRDRHVWNLADWKNFAAVQQIDAALAKVRGSNEPSEAAHGTAREPNPPNAPSNQES